MDTESTRAYDRAPRPRLPVFTARRGLERQVGLDNVLRAVGIDRPSTRCGRYELLDKLGEGGMSVSEFIALCRKLADEGIQHFIVSMPDTHDIKQIELIGREIIPEVAGF